MKKRIISFITAITMFLSLVCCVSAEDIDYSCYKGIWSQKGDARVGLEITYCTDTTMDFTFYWYQFAVDIEDARINGTKVYGEYYDLLNDGIDFINYEVKGSVTLNLYTNRIEVEWIGYENGEGPSDKNLVLYNDNFVYKTKNTSSNNSSSSSTSQSGSKGTITVNSSDLSIYLNGNKVSFPDARPFVDSAGRTQVPVRFVAEELGFDVEWTYPRIVSIKNGIDQVSINVGSPRLGYNIGGRIYSILMDTSAKIVNDRTYIPVRYVAEAFGYDVNWQ